MTGEVIQIVEEQFVVIDSGEPMTLIDETETIIVSEAVQGPMGPRGLPAVASLTDVGIAATALGGHRVVRFTADNTLDYASPTTLAHSTTIAGITTHSASTGGEIAVQSRGRLEESSWTWESNKPVYLGANGTLTQTEPSSPSSAFLLVVGYAIAPTILSLAFRSPILLS